jgi:ABC-type transport system involved in cytochrome c biogenesis permease subunit
MNGFSRILPWFVAGLAVVYLGLAMIPPSDPAKGMQLQKFGELPIVDGGRVKPLDSLARNTMMIISNRQTFTDDNGKTQPAIKWVLDVMTHRLAQKPAAERYKVFRIENGQVLNLLGLPERPGSWRYSIEEFGGKMGEIERQAKQAHDLDPKQRDLFDTKIIELAQHLQLYVDLAQWEKPLAVPPQAGSEEWQPFLRAMLEARQTGQENPAARALGKILLAYAEGKPDEFNQEVAAYHQSLQDRMPQSVQKAGFESFFNHFAPFYHCSVLYVFVFLLSCLSWVAYTQPLNRAAFWLTLVTLLVHTWAIGARMYIQERPPVTNLYASAVFIGWGCVILGLILEWMYKNGIGNVMAAVTGALTLVIAHNLASGDTLEMLQAVLDTNFWLATHVTVITTGYAATFMAGFLGILLILRGVFTPTLDESAYRTLGRMIYGIVCFAMFCSFVGTVLGGLWADVSWGRFWGWDPKENGALIIVLWNALILHARWGGMVQQRGMAVLAVAGNIVTAWSWFGVNMLGVGLHSYGFMSGAVFWLLVFVGSQLLLMGIGMLPFTWWRSFAQRRQEPRAELKPRGRRETPAVAAK